MKKLLLVVTVHLLVQTLWANPGDSVIVRSFDNFHMNRYGNFDQWVYVNRAKPQAQRIWLKYTLGCLSNGQCEWDYTIKLFARERTGRKDSTLMQAPSFRVNGQMRDSIWYSADTTYQTTFNATTKLTDSVPATPLLLVLYNNATNPLQPTDSIRVWPANFYMYHFDTTGNKTDSFFVTETHKLYRTNTPYYNVFDVINDIEIGRFISPYAKSFPKSFKYDYVFDVTDYAPLFNDSFELRIQYQGYSYGFTATMDLIFIEGTPARDVIKVENVYSGGFPYGRPNNSIENYLPLKNYTTPPNTQSVKAKVLITGHGMESNQNCAEFCAKHFILKHNNNTIANQLAWKDDCGKNAIINQPGTWIYDRSNWCPGEAVPVYEYALNANLGSNNTIDLDMEPFTANGDASYNIAVQLVNYKAFNYELDLGVEDIMAPTNNFWYNRTNPVCDNAQIKLKNHGKTTIQSAEISYKIGNGAAKTIIWTGNLPANQTINITLPWLDWTAGDTLNVFTVEIGKVNNIADGNLYNNKASSNFTRPIIMPERFVVETRTNNRPQENSYTIKNNMGQTVYSRTFTQANTLHRDTIQFSAGCFTFRFEDSGKNGLGFWAQPGEGTGSLRIVTLPSPTVRVLRTFNVDFGTFVELHFTSQFALSVNENNIPVAPLEVYPIPANNKIAISYGHALRQATLFNTQGKQVLQVGLNQPLEEISVETLNNGIYLLVIETQNGQTLTRKIEVRK